MFRNIINGISNNIITNIKGKTIVNGVTIDTPAGASVSVINGKVYVNGKEYTDEKLVSSPVVNVVINGDVENINCGGSVEVNGKVNGSIDCGGSCTIEGDVEGSIDTGGSVTIRGDHQGPIDAGGSVHVK